MYLFNNCHGRNHPYLYGAKAFFDLEITGPQARVADKLKNELTDGETCIVASLDKMGDITFDWYEFSREAIRLDRERNVDCHVYFGKLFKTETLSRREAIKNDTYQQFFNVNGHFKRRSVRRGS
jgi:hypothetical protein